LAAPICATTHEAPTASWLKQQASQSRTVETAVKPRTQPLKREIFSKAKFGK
jgi:hypothetical protein